MELRHYLETVIVKRLLKRHSIKSISLFSDIETLKKNEHIPEIIASHMHTVRAVGNWANHMEELGKQVQVIHIYPSITAFAAILYWMNTNQNNVASQ